MLQNIFRNNGYIIITYIVYVMIRNQCVVEHHLEVTYVIIIINSVYVMIYRNVASICFKSNGIAVINIVRTYWFINIFMKTSFVVH